jgi:hypothetical protein
MVACVTPLTQADVVIEAPRARDGRREPQLPASEKKKKKKKKKKVGNDR